jgi:hypothetical protein
MKKIIALLLVMIMLCGVLASCNKTPPADDPSNENTENVDTSTPGNETTGTDKPIETPDTNGIKLLSFAQTESVENIKSLNGKEVQMMGYMSTLSPINGKFMYLMNLPYQSCPFCIPNTSTLSNTIAVYAKDGKEFKFTGEAIFVTGILDVGNWTDEFGYQYEYRIKDATYEIVNMDELTNEFKLWQSLASSGVVADVYSMFNYINFVCYWPEYTAYFGSSQDYIYPDDVPMFLSKEGQFGYAASSTYFEDLIKDIEEIDKTAFKELTDVIKDCKELGDFAMNELEAKRYSKVSEYTNVFKDEGRMQFKMDKQDELHTRFQNAYRAFSTWLANWEL